jgi:hypothetical protein
LFPCPLNFWEQVSTLKNCVFLLKITAPRPSAEGGETVEDGRGTMEDGRQDNLKVRVENPKLKLKS